MKRQQPRKSTSTPQNSQNSRHDNARLTISGIIMFFLSLCGITLVVLLTYASAAKRFAGNNKAIALIMLSVVSVLTLLCALADVLRRKLMVDRPVQQILEATERIASGDFSVRLTPTASGKNYADYNAIMENINVLAAELGKSEVLKTDFIANVSHELKTPLAVIQTYATGLTNPRLDTETKQTYIQTLQNAAKKLTHLVTNILSLNKLENSKLRPEQEWIRLDEQIAEAVISFEPQTEKKSLALDVDLDELSVYTAPSLLTLVWNNLLSNAIKFTDEGGSVRVTLKLREGNAVVTVSDTGCGIPAGTGNRLFDKFYQGDTSHAAEGNGLGLALVKKVIDVLGGEISVASKQGEGSTFTVLLKAPVQRPAEP